MSDELVAGLGGTLVGAIATGVLSWWLHRTEQIAAKRQELLQLTSRLLEIRDDFQGRIQRIENPDERRRQDALANYRKNVYLETCDAIAAQIPKRLSPIVCAIIGEEFALQSDFAKAEYYLRKSVGVSRGAFVRSFALRALAAFYFGQGPQRDLSKGRRYFAKAAECVKNPQDDYSLSILGFTYQNWGWLELASGSVQEGRQLIEKAKWYYSGMSLASPLRASNLDVLDRMAQLSAAGGVPSAGASAISQHVNPVLSGIDPLGAQSGVRPSGEGGPIAARGLDAADVPPEPPRVSSPVTPERIMQFAWGFAPPLMLEAAIKHRVFDMLDAGSKTLDEVAAETGASPRGLRAVMNALVGLRFLAKDDAGRYSLTPESSAFLVSTKPGYQGGFFKHTSSQLMPKWLQLNEIVRTGRPAVAVNQEGDGSAFFQEFVEDIFPMSYPAAQALAGHLRLIEAAGPISVLDLASGSGVWGIALAQSSPKVTVTAVDWAGVLPATRRITARHGVADRFRFVAGDLATADFGSGHSVATLGHILHSEGEPRSRALLRKTFDALAPGGTIAIAEFLVDPDRAGPPNGLIFAVNMLVNTDVGDAFSFEEIAAWLREAGFENPPRTLDAPGPSPLVLATKPSGGR